MKKWVQTDELQWVREVSNGRFTVLNGNFIDNVYTLQEVDVDLSQFNEEELNERVKGFYDSLKDIRDEYGDAWTMIVAEIIAETTSIDENETFFLTLEELESYLEMEFGIESVQLLRKKIHSQLSRAILLATQVHHGDVDKANKPYIFHPLRVSMNVDEYKNHPVFNHMTDEMIEKTRIVCILHDVVEDTKDKKVPVTLDTLRAVKFDEDIVAGVDGMTRREGETYAESIDRAMQHPYSHLGKVCDLVDNIDMSRLKDSSWKTRQSAVKRISSRYKPALQKLLMEDEEKLIELILKKLNSPKKNLLTEDQFKRFLEQYTENMLDLTTDQVKAVRMATSNNISILDGGAGTGVISTVKAIVSAIRSVNQLARIHVYTATGKSRSMLADRLDIKALSLIPSDEVLEGDLLIIYDPQLMAKSNLIRLLSEKFDIPVLLVTDLNMLSLTNNEGFDLNQIVKRNLIPITQLTHVIKQ